MRSFISPYTDPSLNLALEETIFSSLSPKFPEAFPLRKNTPCVVIGRYQNTEKEINEPFCKKHNIAIVRRTTGGGATPAVS